MSVLAEPKDRWPITGPALRWRVDRFFFIGMALAMITENVVGFTISFLRSDIADELQSNWVKVHAAAFACWLLLFLTQAILIRSQRVDIHRKLGVVGALLAMLMVGLTIGSGISAFVQSPPRPVVEHLMLHVSVHVEMFIFSAFVVAGLLYRGVAETHGRLMLLATMTVGLRFPPLIIRLLFHVSVPHHYEQVAYVIAAMLFDFLFRGRVSRVYLWGLFAFLIVAPGVEWLFGILVPHLVVPPN
jgi:hypothetical protein